MVSWRALVETLPLLHQRFGVRRHVSAEGEFMPCTLREESQCSVIHRMRWWLLLLVVSVCTSHAPRGADSVDTIGDARELLEIPKAFPMVKQSRSADFGPLSPSAWREDSSQQ